MSRTNNQEEDFNAIISKSLPSVVSLPKKQQATVSQIPAVKPPKKEFKPLHLATVRPSVEPKPPKKDFKPSVVPKPLKKDFNISQLPTFKTHIVAEPGIKIQKPPKKDFNISQLPTFKTHIVAEPEPEPEIKIQKPPKKEFKISQLPTYEIDIISPPKVVKSIKQPQLKFNISHLPKYETPIEYHPIIKVEHPPPTFGISRPTGNIQVLNLPKYETPIEYHPIIKVEHPPPTFGISRPTGNIQVLNLPKYETPIEYHPIIKVEHPPPTFGISRPAGNIQVLNLPEIQLKTVTEKTDAPSTLGISRPAGNIQVLNLPEIQLKTVTEKTDAPSTLGISRPAGNIQVLNLPEIQLKTVTEKTDAPSTLGISRPNKPFNISQLPTHVMPSELLPKSKLSKKHIEILPELEVNIARISYNIPTRKDTAVLLVFFDYTGSARILINYLFMREKLKIANIPVFTLELVIDGQEAKISDSMRVCSSSYLFQKEVLIRVLEDQVPEEFTKIVCLDADVIFEDPDWYDKLSTMLDTNSVVQCFENAYWLDISYRYIQKQAKTCFDVPAGRRFYDDPTSNYHPGYGWAFTRSWYKACGFYDLAILGSGDTLFAYGLMGYPTLYNTEGALYIKSYELWKKRLIKCKYTFFPGNLYHLYHGPTAKRQYVSRYDYFTKYSKIEDCIYGKNVYGVYELNSKILNSNMLTFFETRDDDGID